MRCGALLLAGLFAQTPSVYEQGMAQARAGRYAEAEDLLSRALAETPGRFAVLYNLGLAATFAGHPDRARDVLEQALRQQSQNVDVLYSLAYVETVLKQKETALRHLVLAAKLSPKRADVQKLLAITTGDLGAYADSLAAWDRYLALVPTDDDARRERSYTAFCTGQFKEGLTGLRRHVERHPQDAVGHHLLGLAESESDPDAGLEHQEKALALRPDFAEARAARGVLYYRQGKPEMALADLEFAASRRPEALNLDRLGQTYLALDRAADAVRVLRQAAALAPDDSRIQLHLGRALADAGLAEESKQVLDRFRTLGPGKKAGIPQGLVDYMSLSPEKQRADYRARVVKAIAANPSDPDPRLRLLRLQWEERGYGPLSAGHREARLVNAIAQSDVAQLEKITAELPGWPAAWAAWGAEQGRRGAFAACRQGLKKAIDLGALHPAIRTMLQACERGGAPDISKLLSAAPPRDW